MTSPSNQLRYDYYTLPFCKPDKVVASGARGCITGGRLLSSRRTWGKCSLERGLSRPSTRCATVALTSSHTRQAVANRSELCKVACRVQWSSEQTDEVMKVTVKSGGGLLSWAVREGELPRELATGQLACCGVLHSHRPADGRGGAAVAGVAVCCDPASQPPQLGYAIAEGITPNPSVETPSRRLLQMEEIAEEAAELREHQIANEEASEEPAEAPLVYYINNHLTFKLKVGLGNWELF